MAGGPIAAAVVERLTDAGAGGLGEVVLIAVVGRLVKGATPPMVRAALDDLRREGAVRRADGRWYAAAKKSAPPADVAALLAIARSGLHAPALSTTAIELELGDAAESDVLADDEPEPSPQQVRAVAWLIRHPQVAVAAVAQRFADQGGRGRPAVADLRRGLPTDFGVERVTVRHGEARAFLVLTGWCGWDEEHGFEVRVDETDRG